MITHINLKYEKRIGIRPITPQEGKHPNIDGKERFMRISLQDDILRSIWDDTNSYIEIINIALRLWTGCICVTKECRLSSVTEHNPDGTTKREIPYTSEMRAESFEK